MGIGTASLESSLGEPLRLSLPITVDSDEEVGCIQVRARGDDLPAVFNTRSNVVRIGSQTRIEITSAQPVAEPTVGLVVSVGCTSPVSREFVLFLDPPVLASRAAGGDETPRSVVEPTVPRRLRQPAPRRAETPPARPRTPRAARTPDGSVAAARKPRVPRPAIIVPMPNPSVAEAGPPQSTKPAPVPLPSQPTPVTPAGTKDRLSVAPQVVVPVGQAGATSTDQTAPTGPSPATAGGAATPTAPPAAGTPAAVAAANAAADLALMAREQALRQQRDALQARIATLSDQIAALRAQTAALTTRNQALENSTVSPLWFWLVALVALLALIAAAWMARSYLSLKRSVEGSEWWAATQASGAAGGTDDDDDQDDLAALDAGTRMSSGIARPITQIDARASHVITPPPVVSNVERGRPMVRTPTNYPPQIETDFTVSDIEVAMAAVRTVSPPRTQQPVLSDSDLGHLGGPTEPLAYSDPPPAASGVVPAPAMIPAARGPFATSLSADSAATSADLNVPPMDVGSPPGKAPVPDEDPTTSLNFKLDIPENYDPLESDSFKRTEFDKNSPSRAAGTPPDALDFELPTASVIEREAREAAAAAAARHGATALNNLFASTETEKLGADTILDLDDRRHSPLSESDVGRFTATTVDNPSGMSKATMQGRMSRFADLLNQVDEAAATDPLRAIALLRQYVLKEEDIPTILWLRLFDLYKTVDKKQVYEALAEHFARRYNRPMVAWGEKLSDRVPQTPLSSFKELDSQIEASWGMEIGLDRLQTLLCDHNQSDAIVFNAVLQRDLLDAAKIFLLDRDSSIAGKT